ncbi:MAG: hypothetical protein OK422_04020 [Thaumarchaeota archaeon]|nr:hypothetical protein [Nitrososphaerota archaeon]
MTEDKKKYAFVASADQAHTHSAKGPYGYSKSASTYDNLVLSSIRMNNLKRLLNVKKALVEKAKPDSLWQMAMLAGAVEGTNLRPETFSYQIPTYYGMICAGFRKS